MRAVGMRLGRKRGQIFFCRREFIFIGEYFDGERRADHGRRRFDDVEQRDLATELLRESQSVLNGFLRCLGEIGGNEDFFQMQDLRDQLDGVRGLDALSCGFHVFDFEPSSENALRNSCGIVCIFCAAKPGVARRANEGNEPPTGTLANCGTFSRQTALTKPWKMAAHARYAFKPERLNRLGPNVRNRLVNGICRENQL